MSKVLLSCPGQGSQKLGMGKDLADAFKVAKDVFQEVDDVLGFGLSKIMWGEDEAALFSTENAQVAIMATSVASMRVLEDLLGKPASSIGQLVGGHSLGEYSALCIAGAISLADCANLLRHRGKEMMTAAKQQSGAMAALIGVGRESVDKLVEESAQGEVLVVANDNSLKQVVISGTGAAIERAKLASESFGVRRFVQLAVSGAFHSPLMAPAQDAMKERLEGIEIKVPSIPLLSSVSAGLEQEPEAIRGLLLGQITKPVRWTEAMICAKENGIDKMIEVGYGNVLSGLLSQTVQDVEAFQSGTVEKIESTAKAFQ